MSTINSWTRDGHVEVLASHARPGDVYIRSIGKGPIPVSADVLRRALDIEVPQESWDDMDGGVTAAAIEQEVSAASADAWGEARQVGNAAYWRARAEDAEYALADVHERDETVARLEAQLVKAEQGWAKANDRNARQAAMLTVDDAMVRRGKDEAAKWKSADGLGEHVVREILHAALATEPQRPEGVEDIAALLEDMPADLIGGPLTTHEARTLADHLATHGVRITTEEGEHTPACEGGPGLPCDTCGSYWPGDAEGER